MAINAILIAPDYILPFTLLDLLQNVLTVQTLVPLDVEAIGATGDRSLDIDPTGILFEIQQGAGDRSLSHLAGDIPHHGGQFRLG